MSDDPKDWPEVHQCAVCHVPYRTEIEAARCARDDREVQRLANLPPEKLAELLRGE